MQPFSDGLGKFLPPEKTTKLFNIEMLNVLTEPPLSLSLVCPQVCLRQEELCKRHPEWVLEMNPTKSAKANLKSDVLY